MCGIMCVSMSELYLWKHVNSLQSKAPTTHWHTSSMPTFLLSQSTIPPLCSQKKKKKGLRTWPSLKIPGSCCDWEPVWALGISSHSGTGSYMWPADTHMAMNARRYKQNTPAPLLSLASAGMCSQPLNMHMRDKRHSQRHDCIMSGGRWREESTCSSPHSCVHTLRTSSLHVIRLPSWQTYGLTTVTPHLHTSHFYCFECRRCSMNLISRNELN